VLLFRREPEPRAERLTVSLQVRSYLSSLDKTKQKIETERFKSSTPFLLLLLQHPHEPLPPLDHEPDVVPLSPSPPPAAGDIARDAEDLFVVPLRSVGRKVRRRENVVVGGREEEEGEEEGGKGRGKG
jgi:hypothetical protein